jgi:accessory gene regulator protein AgrB
MRHFFSFQYWFNFDPKLFTFSTQIAISVFLLLLLFAGIFFFFYRKKAGAYKVLAEDLHVFSLSNFVIGVFLFFFAYQKIYFLSARFWFLFWFILMFFWALSVFKKFRKIILKREERKKRKEFEKYLP